jgi:hypothetical protein
MLREGGASSNHYHLSAITGSSAGACHRAGHFGPDPLADDDIEQAPYDSIMFGA